jgi:hypothetical protein
MNKEKQHSCVGSVVPASDSVISGLKKSKNVTLAVIGS